jgi:hypothetical protein
VIFEEIKICARPGMMIPKPLTKNEFLIKGWGKRRGESALIYTIPNHKHPSRILEKGITISEFEKAFIQVSSAGNFTRAWFNMTLPKCAMEGSCNFTSIGGVFTLLGLVYYSRRGVYERTTNNAVSVD